jgi:multidrug efflux pump subunit AcrA (membrane-fusion protein)
MWRWRSTTGAASGDGVAGGSGRPRRERAWLRRKAARRGERIAATARLVLGTLAMGLAACGAVEGATPAEQAVPVRVAQATPSPVDEYSDYLATIRSARSVAIRPQVEGYVSRIVVRPGEDVREGALLVQIDPKRQEATTHSALAASGIAAAEVERAKATLSQLEAQRDGRAASLKLAQDQHRRASELLRSGAVAQQAEDEAAAALDVARAELAALDRQIVAQRAGISSTERSFVQSQASAEAQTVELGYFKIAAPFAGTVGDVPVKVGDLVTPATLLTTVDDPGQALEAYVSVPVEDARKLRAGLAARVLDSSSRVVDEGTVVFVSPRVDPATQSVLARVDLLGKGGPIRAQQFLRARIVWSTLPSLRVPMNAVARMNGQTFLYVVSGGTPAKATQVPVKLGPVQGPDVVVRDGLKAGDRFVVAGIQKLRNGATVAIDASPPAGADETATP